MIEYLPSGKVVLDSGADKIPEVKKLYSSDKTAGKVYFNNALTYTYFMYRKGSRFESMFPKKRAAEVCKIYFQDREAWKKYEENKTYQEFRDYYIKLQYSTKEQAVHSVLKEIEELIIELQTIKFWVDDIIEVEVTVEIPKFEGSTEMVKKNIRQKQKIKRDNKEEKLKAITAIDTLLKQEARFKLSIKEDIKIQKEEASRSLMDSGSFDNEE